MIFIDTNIYLDFFNNSQPQLKKLLSTLVELRSKVIVPRQVVYEVSRNKVQKLAESLTELHKKARVESILLPEQHDLPGTTGKVQDWNRRRRALQQQAAELEKESRALIATLLADVQHGRDPVSLALSKVFENAIDPTDAIVVAARDRRERGNPPGKKSDTLGDQLSWETLLSFCEDKSDLWFVSRDEDFGVHYDESLYFNAFLQNELTQKLPTKKVHAFSALPAALKHYAEVNPRPVSLPRGPELDTIADEEKANRRFETTFIPDTCPRCHRQDTFSGGFARPSQFGGWTYHVVCLACGVMLDTGQQFDD